ncbi:hypothetical protein CCACVL1_25942, partial [Corchorus capsularis]
VLESRSPLSLKVSTLIRFQSVCIYLLIPFLAPGIFFHLLASIFFACPIGLIWSWIRTASNRDNTVGNDGGVLSIAIALAEDATLYSPTLESSLSA